MKKVFLVCMALVFAVPAFAADWAFYGSERIATWYYDRTYGNGQVNGKNDDQGTQWYFQGNSRLGAKVKADAVTGQIELGLGAGGDGGDTNVVTRRAFGVWKISELVSLKVGKDFSPITDFVSNQWYDSDGDLYGEGNFYGRRPAGITLNIGNFELAALTPTYGYDSQGTNGPTTGASVNSAASTTNGINNAQGGDSDSYIPRFEAAYQWKMGAGYIRPFGGFQYYTVTQNGAGNITGDIDVWSWALGVSTKWNIGAFSIGGQLSYGMNEGAVNGWDTGSNARSSSSPYLKNFDDVSDVYTLQALIVAGLKFTDTLRFEWGVGYRADNPDGAGPTAGYSAKNGNPDEEWVTYLQALVTLAPGVYFCPEVGYYDYMDAPNGRAQGNQWYVGAKWQIDF